MSTSTNATAKVPEFVYANNGARYHPCLYCCRAFAHKRYLSLHMKACIRTHLNEDDHKPSVSVFPSTSLKQEKRYSSRNNMEINLTDEITIQKVSKRHNIGENSESEDYHDDEDEEIAGPTLKRFKPNEGSSEDENANMPEELNRPGKQS
ncbi:hypothetical protein Trydic_g21786 [Trypoxylus dichotomus]